MNKYLEKLKEAIVIIYHQPCFSEKQKEQIINTVIEVCEKAEKYDKKETLKKPYYLNYGGYQVGNWKCPSCDGIVARDEYCKHCGQKLDWSDKDE